MTEPHLHLRRLVFVSAISLPAIAVLSTPAVAQAAAAQTAPAAARQRGTVKAIAGSTLTLTSDDGQQITVAVASSAKIVQLAPGSTDLKSAQPITLADVAVGDRILVIGAAGTDPGSFSAGRVILMKSTDIAAQREREEADWQRRGTGGPVASVDPTAQSISMTSRGRTTVVKTTPSTIFRRYASDSVKFQDAKRGSFDQIQAGDQIRVRGTRSADGSTIDADEIVSGRFENLSGTLTAVDASAGTVTLRDLATKRVVTIDITGNSAVHVLPPEMAASLGRQGSGSGTAAAARPGGGSEQPRSDVSAGAPAQQAREGGHRPGDLSQMVSRLPTVPLANLHPGDAVLVVASPASPGSSVVTAITLLSGVQSLLSAAQGSAPAVTLSPWSLGESSAEGATQ